MDFYEVLDTRRSIRAYTDETIAPEIFDRLANAVYTAPSACNRQPYRFLAVTNPEVKERIGSVCKQEFLKKSPAIIVAVGNPTRAWKRNGDNHNLLDIDVAIAMENLVLAATAEGLGTCWVASFDVAEVNRALELEAPWSAIILSPLGYPAEKPVEFNRPRSIGEVFEVVD